MLDSFAGFIQGNEAARENFGVVIVGDEINQVTLDAWASPGRLIGINARLSVMKGRLW